MKSFNNNRTIFSLTVGSFFLVTFTNSYAYLDPGTGSMILQSILAAIIGAIAFLGTIRYRIVSYLSRLKKKLKGLNKGREKGQETEN